MELELLRDEVELIFTRRSKPDRRETQFLVVGVELGLRGYDLRVE